MGRPYLEAARKVQGLADYADDFRMKDALHVKFVRATHPHAHIVHIDTAEAMKLEGVSIPGVKTLHSGYKEALAGLPFDDRTFVTIMTYNHTLDREILAWCLDQPHAYLGMIGSRRKVAVTRRLFEEEGKGTLEQHDNVDMPMGLDIGAEAPDEISISILAQLISVKNKKIIE